MERAGFSGLRARPVLVSRLMRLAGLEDMQGNYSACNVRREDT